MHLDTILIFFNYDCSLKWLPLFTHLLLLNTSTILIPEIIIVFLFFYPAIGELKEL